jgi:RecB family exonuclease
MKHKPFDDNTLEVEKKIIINLDENGRYKIQGFIDRLDYNKQTKEFEVHDYKTSNSHPVQENLENDRQLALYSIAIKNLFGQDKKICLVWHYLAHDIKICSRRTNEQLENLKKETIELIERIESTKKFPAYISKLCDWCEYKSICQAWVEKTPTIQKKLTLTDEKVEELDIWT